MIAFNLARHSFLQIRTKPKQISTAQNRATVARKVALTLQNYSEREDVCVEEISKDETYPIKSKKVRAPRVQWSKRHRKVCPQRRTPPNDLLQRVPQWQTGQKKHEFFMVFRRNIVTGITRNTFSDKGMLLVTFVMKNIFIDFPTPILKHIFCIISSKIQ